MLYNIFFLNIISEFSIKPLPLHRFNNEYKVKVMNEIVGNNAGAIWMALNENGAMNTKDLKKAAKIKNDKDLYIAMGWLLREDKLTVSEADKVITVTLK